MSGQDYDKSNPTYYDQFFGMTGDLSPCEVNMQDDIYGEYISMYGGLTEIYLVSAYNPQLVFGEDPVKKYEVEPFQCKCIWDLTPEILNMGKFGKNTDQEVVIIYAHMTTVKESIKNSLIAAGIIPVEDTIPDDTGCSKYDRHRRELQEGDMIKMEFNNIHYEIDGIKEEPEYQHLWHKYIYEIHARPRLVSGEDLGDMQPVTDADEIRIEHEDEIQIEADKILF